MKKFYLLCLLWVLLPQTANAVLIVPSADVNIVINTNGGDDSFAFQFYGSGLFSYFENFSLTTNNGSASHTVRIPIVNDPDYRISQDLPAGWALDHISCDSNFSISDSVVHLSISAFSTTNCIFFEKKLVSRNPVLFIPGIIGTELYDGIDKIWPNPVAMALDRGDQFMDPLGFDQSLMSIKNLSVGGVVKNPDGLYNYSQHLIDDFRSLGYGENVDFFTFPYDWRYGTNEINVQLLKSKIDDILAQTGASKVDVIAHSAGGVLLKQYILQNPDHHVGKAVLVGVPNLGAPQALKILLEGDNMSIPVLSAKEIKKIARNMPGVYQLTPSSEYQNIAGASFATHTQNLLSSSDHDFGYSEMQSYLATKDLNSAGFTAANTLHTPSFDNADISSSGVDVYNIVGCQQPTLGKIIERKTDNPLLSPVVNGYATKFVAGDGTVPLVSSEHTASGSPVFYALNSDHGKMPSQEGIRQEIVKLISGNQNIQTTGITQDRSACKLNGKQISIYSPLDISVTDLLGNVTKVTPEGDVQVDIPGSNLEVLGDHKFLFLPEGDYQIKLDGTGDGTFTLVEDKVVDDQITQRQAFVDVPVSVGSSGALSSEGDSLTMSDQILKPSYVLEMSQLNDSVAPVTEIKPIGLMGQIGTYRSDMSISFAATDDNSGLLKTQFSLDGADLKTYTSTFKVASEGKHSLIYFSTDNAGNVESAKTFEFTIDKTPPEFVIQFDPAKKDLVFSSEGTVVDEDNIVTLTDPAGNVTKMILKEKERKKKQKAEILKLFYNGIEADVNKNKLVFSWQYSGSTLKSFTQQVQSKKEFNIEAEYEGKNTKLSGRDSKGKISKILPGLVLLKINTQMGDIDWSY